MKDKLYACTAFLRRSSPHSSSSQRTISSKATTTAKPTAATKPTAASRNLKQLEVELSPSETSYHWETLVPSEAQLSYADKIFAPTRHSPIKLFSASKFFQTPMSSLEPEVTFLGRSNVGKSSLLNAVMGKEVCWTSSKPGRTREMNAFGVGGTKGGESKLVILDMPGYGKASRVDWGVEIMKYLQNRKQLRRVFLLIDSVHGLKKTDEYILGLLRKHAIPHQVVLSKVDKVLSKRGKQEKTTASAPKVAELRKLLQDMRPIIQPANGRVEGPGALGEIITCSAADLRKGRSLGISALRWAILSAVGLDANFGMKKVTPTISSGSSTSDSSVATS